MTCRRILPIAVSVALGTMVSGCALFSQPSGYGDESSVTTIRPEQRAGVITPANNEALARILVRVAGKARGAGDLETAARFLSRARSLEPSDADSAIQLGRLLLDQKQYAGAADALADAVKLRPEDVDSRLGLARALLHTGQPDIAAEHLRVVVVERKTPPVFNLLGNALQLIGKSDEARDAYASGLDLAPDDRALTNNLAVLMAQAGDTATAVGLLKTISAGPIADDAHRRNLALAHTLQGDGGADDASAEDDRIRDFLRSPTRAFALIEATGDAAYPLQVVATAAVPGNAPTNIDVARALPTREADPASAVAIERDTASGAAIGPDAADTVGTTAMRDRPVAGEPAQAIAGTNMQTVSLKTNNDKKQSIKISNKTDSSAAEPSKPTEKAVAVTVEIPPPPEARESWAIAGTASTVAPAAGMSRPSPAIPVAAIEKQPHSAVRSGGMATTDDQNGVSTLPSLTPVETPRGDTDQVAQRLAAIEPAAGGALEQHDAKPGPAPAADGALSEERKSILDRLMSFNVGQLVEAVRGETQAASATARPETKVRQAAQAVPDTPAVVPSPKSRKLDDAMSSTPAPAPEMPKGGRMAALAPDMPQGDVKPPATVPPSESFRVQLGAYRDPKAAQQGWYNAVKAASDVLGRLNLSIERTNLGPDKGVFFRLRTGGVPDRDSAQALCDRIKSRSISCFVAADGVNHAAAVGRSSG